MNSLTVHRPTRDPLLSSAGRATALATRYVWVCDLSSFLLILHSASLSSPRTVVALITHEEKTMRKGVERDG